MLVTRSSMPRMHELIFHLTAERNNLSKKCPARDNLLVHQKKEKEAFVP